MQFYNHTQCDIDHVVYYLVNVTPCNLVVVYQYFGVMHCLSFQTPRMNQVRKQAEENLFYLTYSAILKMDAISSSETSVNYT